MGHRLGADLPKGLVQLEGQQLVTRAVAAMAASGRVDLIVVALPAGFESSVDMPSVGIPVEVITGGVLRQDSVRLMLGVLPHSISHVLVHDAARCLVPTSLIARVADALDAGAEAVVPVLPVVDTVARVDEAGDFLGNVPRNELRLVQTPQGFRRSVLVAAHTAADPQWEATDDASVVVANGGVVRTVPGDPAAMKVTTAEDLLIAKALLTSP